MTPITPVASPHLHTGVMTPKQASHDVRLALDWHDEPGLPSVQHRLEAAACRRFGVRHFSDVAPHHAQHFLGQCVVAARVHQRARNRDALSFLQQLHRFNDEPPVRTDRRARRILIAVGLLLL